MASIRPVDANHLLDQFLNAKQDSPTVHNIDQRLEIHLTGTTAYITSYTRQVMDRNHGAPVMAVNTRTVEKEKRVYIYPAQDPKAKDARKLRSNESLGPAYFAFGVPLRRLKLKLPAQRKYILPLNTLEVPGTGIVYWTAMVDLEHELRNTAGEAASGTQK